MPARSPGLVRWARPAPPAEPDRRQPPPLAL